MSCLKVYKEEKWLGKKLNTTPISYDSVFLIFERSWKIGKMVIIIDAGW